MSSKEERSIMDMEIECGGTRKRKTTDSKVSDGESGDDEKGETYDRSKCDAESDAFSEFQIDDPRLVAILSFVPLRHTEETVAQVNLLEKYVRYGARDRFNWCNVRLTCKRFNEISCIAFDPSVYSNFALRYSVLSANLIAVESLLKDKRVYPQQSSLARIKDCISNLTVIDNVLLNIPTRGVTKIQKLGYSVTNLAVIISSFCAKHGDRESEDVFAKIATILIKDYRAKVWWVIWDTWKQLTNTPRSDVFDLLLSMAGNDWISGNIKRRDMEIAVEKACGFAIKTVTANSDKLACLCKYAAFYKCINYELKGFTNADNTAAVKCMLKHMRPELVDHNTTFLLACVQCNSDMVSVYLDSGVPFQLQEAFELAVKSNNVGVVKLLIEYDSVDVNSEKLDANSEKSSVNWSAMDRNGGKWCAISYAVYSDSLELVRFLLDHEKVVIKDDLNASILKYFTEVECGNTTAEMLHILAMHPKVDINAGELFSQLIELSLPLEQRAVSYDRTEDVVASIRREFFARAIYVFENPRFDIKRLSVHPIKQATELKHITMLLYLLKHEKVDTSVLDWSDFLDAMCAPKDVDWNLVHCIGNLDKFKLGDYNHMELPTIFKSFPREIFEYFLALRIFSTMHVAYSVSARDKKEGTRYLAELVKRNLLSEMEARVYH